MGVYEITTDGGTYQIETADPAPDPTGQDYAIGALKGIGRGALDLFTAPADLLYRGGNAVAEALGASPLSQEELQQGYPSARAKQFYDYISAGALDDPNFTAQSAPQGNQTAEDIGRGATNLATAIMIPSQGGNIAKQIPLLGNKTGLAGLLAKGAGYGLEGAGYNALAQSAEENPLKNAEYAAALNMLFPAIGAGIGKIGKAFGNSADALERGAVGATPGDFSKSLKYKGAVGAGTDDVGSKLAQSIRNISEEGGFAGAKDPASLFNKTVAKINELGDSLDPVIAQADEAIKAKGYKVYPKFEEAQKFVDSAKATERKGLQKLLDEAIQDYRGDLDGTVSSMHQLKKQIYRSSYTEAGKAKDVLDTAIAKDLKRSIENATDMVLPAKQAGVIKATNARLGDYLDYKKIATRQLGKEEGKNIAKTIGRGIFTTGGIAAPAIVGGLAGDGEGALLGGIGGLSALTMASPRGQFALSQLLRTLGGPTQKLGQATGATGRLSSLLLGGVNRESQDLATEENIPIPQSISEAPMVQDKNPIVLEKQENISKSSFDSKLDKVANNLGLAPSDLKQVIKFESAGTFSPSVRNKQSGAVGLIQFIPETAQALTGEATKEAAMSLLASMSAEEQLDYVEKHLKPYAGRIKTFEDLYMAILKPVAIGKPNSYPLFKEGTTAYKQNRGLDSDDDGVITKIEATNKVRKA